MRPLAAAPFAAAALALALAVPASADFDFTAYRPTTLAAVAARVAKEHPEVLRDNDVAFHPAERYRVAVAYRGKKRAIDWMVREVFIAGWCKSFSQPHLKDLFQREIEVTEAGRSYWLPIQDSLVDALDQEVKPGAPADLYVVYAGTAGKRQVFLVMEFQAR
jgi:hypothetical protein